MGHSSVKTVDHMIRTVLHNNAINSDGQARRFALRLPAGYGKR